MQTLAGKVVIVTGASSGVGEAAALQFAQEGAKVVVAARREDKSQAVVRQIEALGGEGIFIKTDVTKRVDIEALVDGTMAKFGLIGLSKTAAIDYAQQGIRVNVVAPGFTHSEIVDPYVEAAPEMMKAVVSRYSALNRLGHAAETAEAITWLCSDAARFVNGAVLPVDGGDTSRLY